MTAPLLVFGWGNLSRGDDALGPMFVEQLRAQVGRASEGRVEFLEDYQLQPEHALDLSGREQVLFVDASITCSAPFEVRALQAQRDSSFTSHAMTPEALLQAYRELNDAEPPACTLLAIRGEQFELGCSPAASSLEHLAQALSWGLGWLRSGGA